MRRTLRNHPMDLRRWIGLGMIFAFLPANIPLWQSFVKLPTADASEVTYYYLMFILGALLLFFPSRGEMKDGLMPTEEE